MAKIFFDTQCACGSKVSLGFKEPTRMQHTVSKAECIGCGSRYLMSCEAEQDESGKRTFKVDPNAIGVSEKLQEIMRKKAVA